MAAPSGSSLDGDDGFVFVFDRRTSDAPEIKIKTGELRSFSDLKNRVKDAFKIINDEDFVIATTNRDEIKDNETWQLTERGDTLYILKTIGQELCAPAQERVNYLPHYDTIVKGGMYEYYASEGQNPLPYAFAELIDNALAATVNNVGSRTIEIRLHFDDANPSKSCICVIDNGKGMTPKQLNNWAIYRLSKFIRKEPGHKGHRNGTSDVDGADDSMTENVEVENIPHYMNSDISYFGVGGKQAIFYIGNSTRMVSKPKDSKDVHELTISKEEFEKKEKNNESIYSGYIRNRKAGDNSHIPLEDEVIRKLVEEETTRESFTAVIVQNLTTGHVPYLKNKLHEVSRQLAHIYHYYIHGPNGNVKREEGEDVSGLFKNIDIQIKVYNRGQSQPTEINLRDIDDDMQTLFVQSSASTFEFKATIEGYSAVEGLLRYHPFLYEKETYPSEAFDPRIDTEPEDDHDYAINDRPARGRRPVFECYWNGRLIPYTYIEDFEWCSVPKKIRNIPSECYNRISGVLWTNDSFQVSTNKLTFLDLEIKLRDKSTTFTRVISGHEKRTLVEKDFPQWLRECHEQHDKQIYFSGYRGVITRTDLPKQKQSPWAVFDKVEWDGREYKKGMMVRIQRTMPVLMGTIKTFLLYGEYDGNVFSTGGDIEVIQEPRSLYDDVRIVPLSKLDRTTSEQTIRKYIEDEEAKLPDKLIISWPSGLALNSNEKRPAGKAIGDIKIEIANKKGELISKLPGTASASKKLLIEYKLLWHSPQGDEVIVSHISQHGKTWPYWFRKMENIKNLGAHTLQLQTILNESGTTMYAGRELPFHRIKFIVTEAEPERFVVGLLDGPFRVGVPFQIPLEFQDKFNHPAKPSSKLKPVLEATGLDISYDSMSIKGNTLTIKGVVAKGQVTTNSGKNFSFAVRIPDLEEDSQTMKIRLLPGPPHSLLVSPEDELEIENGSPVSFNVKILDVMGNLTADGKQTVVCRFTGASGLPTYSMDCSNFGSGTLTGASLMVKRMKECQTITAKIDMQGHKDVLTVDRSIKISPSGRVAYIEVYYTTDEGDKTVTKKIANSGEVTGIAGQSIKGLSFKLTDEGGRDISLNDKTTSKIKVNWVPKVSKETFLDGKLPDIKIPNSVSDSKYCHINVLDGPGLEFTFSVRGCAGPPHQMKCTCDGSSSLQIGQPLTGEVVVKIRDKNGNEITDLPPSTSREMKITGECLKADAAMISKQQKHFVIRGIQFVNASLGHQEVEVSWNDLKDFVRFDILAGPPCKIELVGWNLNQPVTVYNDSKLPHPLKVQLLDEGGNPSKTADVKVQIAKDPKLKLVPFPQPLKTNAHGIADFGIISVCGPSGLYEIQPKAFVYKTVLSGPKIKVNVQPDPNNPQELIVDYSKNATFTAGEKLTEFSVKVMAEDGNIMTTANTSYISLKLWKSDSTTTPSVPPSKAITLKPETPNKSEKGIFHFRGHKLPEIAGAYNLIIVYFDRKHELYSTLISITVHPGPPVEISPDELPGTPTVSNTRNAAARCLIRNLKVMLRDQYRNLVSEGYNGSVELKIGGPSGVSEIPVFVGGSRSLTIPLSKGVAYLQNLMLQENTHGKDGLEYSLRCGVSCSIIPKNRAVEPLVIPFLFYNDAKKQSQMSALSKERDNIQSALRVYKSMFDTQEQLINELRMAMVEAGKAEQKIRAELRKQNIPGSQLQQAETVEKLIQARMKEREQLLKVPRRCCGLQPMPKGPEVLGKIAHLGMVQDADIARVLSWHMSADMDCVVTLTTKRAKEIYHQTNGKQQVLPLDSIYRKNLPDWSKPLPHVRFRPSWRPAGNPVYARNLLIFSQDDSNCKIVFGMLLGDTLILDSLDYANIYRQEIVKHTHCPTILTRDGERIRSNGKFGGAMNRALPIEKLRGAVFGEPLPMAYHALCTQIDTLQNYKSALVQHGKAEEDLQEQLMIRKEPEMAAKYKECEEAEKQLKEIEHKLGVGLQSRESLPNLVHSRSQSPPPLTKRPRVSGGRTPPAASAPPPPVTELDDTPTRASKRIASMTTVITDDGRKKLRKT